jgi:hypothetical protein
MQKLLMWTFNGEPEVGTATTSGYLISIDGALRKIEQISNLYPAKAVHIDTPIYTKDQLLKLGVLFSTE